MSSQERSRFVHLFDDLKVADEERRRKLDRQGDETFADSEGRDFVSYRPQVFRELKRVSICGMKAINKIELKLPSERGSRSNAPCMMLLGENSVGKSTTLSAIALALIGTKETKRLNLDFSEYVRSAQDGWDQLDAEPIRVLIEFYDSKDIAEFIYHPIDRTIKGSTNSSTAVLGYGPRRYFDPRRVERRAGSHRRVKTLFDPLAVIPYPIDWLRSLWSRNNKVLCIKSR
jgi:hypothetical protein